MPTTPTLTLVDDFNRSEDPLTTPWVQPLLSGSGSSLAADGTKCHLASGSLSDGYRDVTSYGDTVGVFATVAENGTTDAELFLFFYLQGSGLGSGTPNGYYVSHRQRPSSTDTLRIGKVASGALSVLNSITQDMNVGDIFGGIKNPATNVITFWQQTGGSWSALFTTTDSSYTGGGKIGAQCSTGGSGNTALDDLRTGVVSQPNVSANAGTLTLTGTAAALTLKQLRKIAATAGGYALTGTAATLSRTQAGIFTDTFSRANNTDLGPDWTPVIASPLNLLSNTVVASALSEGCEEVCTTFVPSSGAMFARVTINTFTGADPADAGVLIRAAAPGTRSFYAATIQKNDATTTTIFKRVAGTYTLLASENATGWSSGDTLQLSGSGSTLTVRRNGVVLLTASDSDLVTGYAGLRIREDGTLTNTRLGTFTAGNGAGLAAILTAQAGQLALTGTVATLRTKKTRMTAVGGVYAVTGTAATLTLAIRNVLTWQDNATDETGFSIERKAEACAGTTQPWVVIASVGANVLTYSDTAIVRGTTYAYRVRAFNANGNSVDGPYGGYTNCAERTVPADAVPPAVSITGPTSSAIYSTPVGVELTGTASDNIGVVSMQWSLTRGATTVTGAVTYSSGPGTWTTVNLAAAMAQGVNVVVVSATDAGGNVTTDTVTVMHSNAATDFPSTGFLDQFNRANGAIGANWTSVFSSPFTIAGNLAAAPAVSPASARMLWNPGSFSGGHEVYGQWPTIPSDSSVMLVFGSPSLTDSGYHLILLRPENSLLVARITGGYTEILGPLALGPSYTNGQQLGVRVSAAKLITLYWQAPDAQWYAVGSITDASMPSPAYIGMAGFAPTTIENFGGGAVTIAAPPSLWLEKSH